MCQLLVYGEYVKTFYYCLDSANTGKTTALNATRTRIEQLITKKGAPYTYDLVWGQHGRDFRGYFTFEEHRIGISSAGDFSSAVDDGLNALAPICDIVILATRSKQSTVDSANAFISGTYPNSEVVWLTKEHLADTTTPWTMLTLPRLTSLMARHTAESITEIIQTLRPGTF